MSVLHARICKMSWNCLWALLHLCCHKSSCCNWGRKQRPSLFNKHLSFEFTELADFPSWKKGHVKTWGISSTVVKQWSELSAVVWVLRTCSSHGQLVHIYNTTVCMSVFANITRSLRTSLWAWSTVFRKHPAFQQEIFMRSSGLPDKL